MSTLAEQPVVELTTAEMILAGSVGVIRQSTNLSDGREDAHGAARDNGWQLHIDGALGELAVAKFLNLFWSGQLGNLRADDVGSLQVRTTTHDAGRLLIHKTDPDDKVFVLVVGYAPSLRLAGWILGRDAKQEKWWDDPMALKGREPRPCFCVPQLRLNPMAQLVHRPPLPAAPVVEAPESEHPF